MLQPSYNIYSVSSHAWFHEFLSVQLLFVHNFKGELHSNGTFIHLANKNKYCKLTSLLSQSSRLFTNNILKTMQLCLQCSCQTSRSTLWDHAYITRLICCYEVSSKVKASIYIQLLSGPLPDFRTRRGKFRALKALASIGGLGACLPRKFWNLEAQKCSCKHFPCPFSSENSILASVEVHFFIA